MKIKPRVLVIETGGTIAQKRGRDGIFRPVETTIIHKVKGLSKFADVQVERLPKLIDSTNMLTEQRAALARMIYERANQFDGFVIIHGTDTMVDTAAALTFMLQGLYKPIVLTGSQISAYEPRTDGIGNVFAAVKVATQDYGEVVIAFGNGVYRGPRTIKDDEEGFNAFLSPRTPPIGKIGIVIEAGENRIRRNGPEIRAVPDLVSKIMKIEKNGERLVGLGSEYDVLRMGTPILELHIPKLELFTDFDTSIGFFYPMSGVRIDTFTAQVKNPNIHGFVMVGFGAGNIPEVYYDGIRMATRMHKPIVVVTQCSKGAADMGIYEVGAIPLQLGAISGADMTMQTATQKLMYALGKANAEGVRPQDRVEFVKNIIHTIYAREISVTERRI